jgi:hypothetical protein
MHQAALRSIAGGRMNKTSVWSRVRGWWQPQSRSPLREADDLVVTDPRQVGRALADLARQRSPLILQTADGTFVGGGTMSLAGEDGVRVHLLPHAGMPATPVVGPVNVSASGQAGLVLFTLHGRASSSSRLLNAPRPHELVLVQTRRHFRVQTIRSDACRAWLRRENVHLPVQVVDLSEDGLGFSVPVDAWPQGETAGTMRLQFDDDRIDVPRLEVVHVRLDGEAGLTRIGARILGLSEEERKVLRRWITSLQVEQADRRAEIRYSGAVDALEPVPHAVHRDQFPALAAVQP